MTDRATIAAEPRTVTGKKVKQLRRQGLVPGVIYGQSEPVNIQMEEIQLNRALRVAGSTQLTTLDVEGKEYTVLAREIQQHVTRRTVLHIDFMEVDMTSTITSVADLVLVGESPAMELEEGMIAQAMFSVDIECLPDALISQIEVDVSAILTPGDRVQIVDLDVPEGVTLLVDEDATVARFQTIRIVEEEEEEEELEGIELDADGVEVIGREEEEEFEE
jgi:large subunit ribosomal protein L25